MTEATYTLKQARVYVPPALIAWIEGLGVTDDEPLRLNINRDIERDYEREEREGNQWKER